MAEIVDNIQNNIIKILEENNHLKDVSLLLDEYHHYELAKVLINLDDDLFNKLYQALPLVKLTEAIETLSPEEAFNVFERLNIQTLIQVIDLFETDDLVDIIDFIEDKDKQVSYLSLIASSKRKIIKSYLHFDDDMVGSIMNNNFVSIHNQMTVKKAIKSVVDQAPNVEYIHNIYVVDDYNHLVGTLSLKELINMGNEKAALIKDFMNTNLVYLYPTTNVEEAIDMMKNYDFQLLPVVNTDQNLIGIISFDDTVDAMKEESSADYASLAGLTDVEITADETVFSSLKKRLPWLIILLFVNLITSSIISGYEEELQTLTTLAVFMPLILNMAGNSSTQGLGVIIRLFATNQLKEKNQIIKHLSKELLTGIINGIIVGIGLFVLVLLFNYIRGTGFQDGLNFAFVISLSISLSLVVATMAGSIVPLLINAIKVDPAVASGPFITTINDIISLLIYFGLTTALISGLS
ncbi:magnesium transporter [Mycoplasmatota bacterium]|nr:magnesium transporter [Mycoplasmatota bacterium]